VAAAEVKPAVAVGGQEPMQFHGHGVTLAADVGRDADGDDGRVTRTWMDIDTRLTGRIL